MQPRYDGVLQVEPTDHCNLSCSMCAPHHEGWGSVHGVPKGLLDVQLYRRILDGLVRDRMRFDHIIFQWLGDPSLHPDLPDLIGMTARSMAGRVGYLRLDTNGIRLTPARIDRLLAQLSAKSPAILVVFTLDAVSAGTYAAVKGQDALDRVRRHIRHLVRARHRHPGHINLQLQFVVQPGNAHEVQPFLRYWTDLLGCQGGGRGHDEIMFKRLSVGGGSAGQADADALYDRVVTGVGIRTERQGPVHIATWDARPWQRDDAHSGARGPCPGLWLTPVIRHDGHLMMCCADLRGELDLGSLDSAGFRELWEGRRATAQRLEHLAGRFEGVCAGCGGINWYDYTEDMGASTRARAGQLGLMPSESDHGPR